MLDIVWAFMKGMRNTLIPIVTAIVGLVIGLFIGWGTVTVTNQAPVLLSERHQDVYLNGVAVLYGQSNDSQFVAEVAQFWDDVGDGVAFKVTVCEEIDELNSLDPPRTVEAQRLQALIDSLGEQCGEIMPDGEEEGGSFLTACLLGLLLLVALGAAYYFYQARQGGGSDPGADFVIPSSKPTAVPDAPPAMGDDGDSSAEGITPIASYRTTYKIGMDQYDDSFSIESAAGDFLGECGVGISESLSGDGAKKATAMEVWLFDKNDIRTITKVAMSDHAFFDDAIKAKLAPKGEPVMARPDEIVVLETASLIINAKITELEYGADSAFPEKSYFERFGIELSAWAKEGAESSDGGFGFDG